MDIRCVRNGLFLKETQSFLPTFFPGSEASRRRPEAQGGSVCSMFFEGEGQGG